MKPDKIRATLEGLWPNSLETEFLSCIALALVEIVDRLEGINKLLTRTVSCPSDSNGKRDPLKPRSERAP